MTPVELSRTVLCAVRSAVVDGELDVVVPSRAVVVPPGPGGSGDYATNIALQLAREAGRPPRDVAEVLRARLCRADGVADVLVSGPGFLNVHFADDLATSALVRRIRAEGERYGYSEECAGDEPVLLRVPFDVRAEVVADALVRIIGSQGGRVEVAHGEPATLRPVPAAEDPAPLGGDASRWALLHPAAHDRPRITAEHLVQRESNPLFRVRYAHARTCALARGGARLGLVPEPGETDRADARPCCARSPSTRTPSRTPRGTGRPTGSPGISSAPPTPSSPSSTPCCPSATRNPRPPTAPGSPSPKPPGRCWPAACPCSASVHPSISEAGRRRLARAAARSRSTQSQRRRVESSPP